MGDKEVKNILVMGQSTNTRRIAVQMNRAGHNISVVSPSAAFLETVMKELNQPDTTNSMFPCDLQNKSEVEASLKAAKDKYGAIHTFIHCSLDVGTIPQSTIELVQEIISEHVGTNTCTLQRNFVRKQELLEKGEFQMEPSALAGMLQKRIEGALDFPEGSSTTLLDPTGKHGAELGPTAGQVKVSAM